MSVSKFETGIDPLDRELDGGIPASTFFIYQADPNSKSELLLEKLATKFPTVYITTQRSEEFLKNSFDKSNLITDTPTIVDASAEINLNDHIESSISSAPDNSLIIIDSIDIIEEKSSEEELRQWLNKLYTQIQHTESILLFHAYKQSPDSLTIERKQLLGMADLILELDQEVDGKEVENFFRISKFRGGGDTSERLKVMMDGEIEVDTKRAIS